MTTKKEFKKKAVFNDFVRDYKINDQMQDILFDYNIFIDLIENVFDDIPEFDTLKKDELIKDIKYYTEYEMEDLFDLYRDDIIDAYFPLYYSEKYEIINNEIDDFNYYMNEAVNIGFIDLKKYDFEKHVDMAIWLYMDENFTSIWNNTTELITEYFITLL